MYITNAAYICLQKLFKRAKGVYFDRLEHAFRNLLQISLQGRTIATNITTTNVATNKNKNATDNQHDSCRLMLYIP